MRLKIVVYINIDYTKVVLYSYTEFSKCLGKHLIELYNGKSKEKIYGIH